MKCIKAFVFIKFKIILRNRVTVTLISACSKGMRSDYLSFPDFRTIFAACKAQFLDLGVCVLLVGFCALLIGK